MIIGPTAFNELPTSRSIIWAGQVERQPKLELTAVLLDRGITPFREPALNAISKFGFKELIFVESYRKTQNYNLDSITGVFPKVKFIVPLEPHSIGSMINLAMEEAHSNYVLVLWNDMKLMPGFFSPSYIKGLDTQDTYCTVPNLLDTHLKPLYIRSYPSVKDGRFVIEHESELPNKGSTFYPYDFVAIYSKKRFIDLLGYDNRIASPYWQNLDLAFRSWLWGERTVFNAALQIAYSAKLPGEDQSATIDSSLFYLKNLAIVEGKKGLEIPMNTLVNFKLKSRCSLNESIKLFLEARKWFSKTKGRFKTSAVSLMQYWE